MLQPSPDSATRSDPFNFTEAPVGAGGWFRQDHRIVSLAYSYTYTLSVKIALKSETLSSTLSESVTEGFRVERRRQRATHSVYIHCGLLFRSGSTNLVRVLMTSGGSSTPSVWQNLYGILPNTRL